MNQKLNLINCKIEDAPECFLRSSSQIKCLPRVKINFIEKKSPIINIHRPSKNGQKSSSAK